ncbi:DUF2238 domain-containing protein [Longispora sp. NPDC051575]|uniref:DUF2238 domain-containing protein n=1 Tax=Longispora sp. NPDC051575 TaxID=3154943 RepID=UPI00342AD5EE
MRRGALIAFALLFAATWWRPQWPAEQALHHSLTVLGLGLLFWVQRRRPLPRSSFLLVLAFLALHTVAARWLYSAVPYDDWTDALFGVRLSDALGWRRNHFDRLVHLAYGLCLGPVLCRHLREALRWPAVWAALGAVTVVTATGALYELLEWGVSLLAPPELAEAYNGQQGDLWDAQKDMAIALLGVAVSATVFDPGLRRYRRRAVDRA